MNSRGVKRERDGEDEAQFLHPPQRSKATPREERADANKRPYKINFNVARWKLLSAKGYTSILKGVEELHWYPVLFDEAIRDFNTFLECYAVSDTRGATTAHRWAVRLVEEQCREMNLPHSQQQLSIAMQEMHKLRALTIMPSRHTVFRPKPERLNVFAFTATIAAFGHKREMQEAETQTRSGRSSKVATLGPGLTKLRIADVDLCALLCCVPSQFPAVPLAQDGFGYAYHLPAGLTSWHGMYLAWCNVVAGVTSLQCQFIRSEAFGHRLERICRGDGTLLEAQRGRTTSVLAACDQLRSLSLSFSFFSASASQSIPVLGLEDPGAASGFAAAGSPTSASGSQQACRVLPELDISYVLPYCNDLLSAGHQAPKFAHLQIFALANVVLSDSKPLLNFVANHLTLEELHLEDVGYRFGPGWNEILSVVATSFERLRTLRLIRLMVMDMVTNSLQYEDRGLYYIIANGLSQQVGFAFE